MLPTMFQTTRRRLALWYTAVTAVLLVLFATGVYVYVRNTLVERVDDTLNHVVEVVQRSLVVTTSATPQVNLEKSFRDNSVVLEDDHIELEWFAPQGDRLWSTLSNNLPIVPLQPDSSGATVQIPRSDREPLALRQVTQPIRQGSQLLGYLRVSEPWFEVTVPTRELVIELLAGTTGMVGIVAGIGWLLSGLAMMPIDESYQRLKQFTADASHELRNPIAVIQTNVQVALSDPEPDAGIQQQHLQVIERLTRRLGRLVEDLLFLARQDSGAIVPERSAVNLAALLAEIIEEQQAIATSKSIQLNLSVPDNLMQETLAIDRDQIRRVFVNLIANALQYTLANGVVNLNLSQVKRSGQSYLQIKVSDTGCGIPASALPQLFERFYRVDPARSKSSGGTGLGLAIVKAIVDQHQGTIQVESQVQQGTTVTVTLPQGE
jgi:two-component system, OmpR family, manganese sensing sensor histidine kinase